MSASANIEMTTTDEVRDMRIPRPILQPRSEGLRSLRPLRRTSSRNGELTFLSALAWSKLVAHDDDPSRFHTADRAAQLGQDFFQTWKANVMRAKYDHADAMCCDILLMT